MDETLTRNMWWWAGDEESAKRRFRERFGAEATLVVTPQPGIVALGPVPEHSGFTRPQQMTFFGGA